MNRERSLRAESIKELRQAFDLLRTLPFPPKPDDDELDDCWVELDLQDSFVAGCASRLLEGQRRLPKATKEDIRLDEGLIRRVRHLRDRVSSDADKEAADAMLRRFGHLQKVIDLVLRVSK